MIDTIGADPAAQVAEPAPNEADTGPDVQQEGDFQGAY